MHRAHWLLVQRVRRSLPSMASNPEEFISESSRQRLNTETLERDFPALFTYGCRLLRIIDECFQSTDPVVSAAGDFANGAQFQNFSVHSYGRNHYRNATAHIKKHFVRAFAAAPERVAKRHNSNIHTLDRLDFNLG